MALALNRGGARRNRPVTISTPFGITPRRDPQGFAPTTTARGKHARVGTGRNMPGTQGNYLSTLNYATSCRTLTRS